MNALDRKLVAMGIMEAEPDWFEVFLAHLKAYKTEQGHCKVPFSLEYPKGYKLGQRVIGLRHRPHYLTNDQRAELNALGFIWNACVTGAWYPEFLEHLKTFKEEHEHCRVPESMEYPRGYKLGQMVRRIRSGGNKITDKQRAELDTLGFIWDASLYGQWYPEFLGHLKAFKAEHGHCQVPYAGEYPEGYRLGERVVGIRVGHLKMTDEQRVELNALGFIWNLPAWYPEFIEHLKAFKTEHGHCQMTRYHVCTDGYKLGQKTVDLRHSHIKITAEQRVELDAIGFVWNASLYGQWYPGFIKYLETFKAEHGHCLVPTSAVVSGIRTGHYRITDEQRIELNTLGFVWDPRDWFTKFIEHLRAFKTEHGHCRVPYSGEYPEGYKLGVKVAKIRSGNNRVTDDQRAELDTLEFFWNARDWYPEFIGHLRAFKAEHGHCQVPYSLEYPKGYKLGQRVTSLRTRNKITAEQRAELNTLGFVWNPRHLPGRVACDERS